MLWRKRQAGPCPNLKFFQSYEILYLISENVLADNHLPEQVPTEIFSRGTLFGLTFCVDENSIGNESDV